MLGSMSSVVAHPSNPRYLQFRAGLVSFNQDAKLDVALTGSLEEVRTGVDKLALVPDTLTRAHTGFQLVREAMLAVPCVDDSSAVSISSEGAISSCEAGSGLCDSAEPAPVLRSQEQSSFGAIMEQHCACTCPKKRVPSVVIVFTNGHTLEPTKMIQELADNAYTDDNVYRCVVDVSGPLRSEAALEVLDQMSNSPDGTSRWELGCGDSPTTLAAELLNDCLAYVPCTWPDPDLMESTPDSSFATHFIVLIAVALALIMGLLFAVLRHRRRTRQVAIIVASPLPPVTKLRKPHVTYADGLAEIRVPTGDHSLEILYAVTSGKESMPHQNLGSAWKSCASADGESASLAIECAGPGEHTLFVFFSGSRKPLSPVAEVPISIQQAPPPMLQFDEQAEKLELRTPLARATFTYSFVFGSQRNGGVDGTAKGPTASLLLDCRNPGDVAVEVLVSMPGYAPSRPALFQMVVKRALAPSIAGTEANEAIWISVKGQATVRYLWSVTPPTEDEILARGTVHALDSRVAINPTTLGPTALWAIATVPSMAPSKIATKPFFIRQVAPPTLSFVEGPIVLASSTAGATVLVDPGDDLWQVGERYVVDTRAAGPQVLTAYATKPGMAQSTFVSLSTVVRQVEPPDIQLVAVDAGSDKRHRVHISAGDPGAACFYTTDGADPVPSDGALFDPDFPVFVSSSGIDSGAPPVIKAIATKPGCADSVMSVLDGARAVPTHQLRAPELSRDMDGKLSLRILDDVDGIVAWYRFGGVSHATMAPGPADVSSTKYDSKHRPALAFDDVKFIIVQAVTCAPGYRDSYVVTNTFGGAATSSI